MELGAFSVSLSVKDLAASREFYEKLGFQPVGGRPRPELADSEERKRHHRPLSRHV